MASERIMQAIDALEQAMDRLERQVAALPPAVPDGELSASGASQARAALKSLDELIAELKAKTDG